MKRAILAATALLSSTTMSTPAWADTIPTPDPDGPNATTQAAEEAQCDALAALHGPATGDNDHWSGEVVPGAATLIAGPTEVADTRVVDPDTIVGTGTFVPSILEIRGDPFRIGGSVNMFGDQWATAGYYPDSTFNYTADFNSMFAYAFSCNIYDAVYHPLVPGEEHPAVPPEGCYTNPGHDTCIVGDHWCGNEETFHWGHDFGNCVFNKTKDGEDAYTDPDTPAYWDDPVLFDNEAGVPINQDETDSLYAFEDHGGPVQVTGEYHVGQVVICISPGSKGGSWRVQNGYNGGSFTGPAAGCNTPYFKIAPTYHGSTTSNGTFTSVPDYNL